MPKAVTIADLLGLIERAPIPMSLTDARSLPGQQPLIAASPAFFEMTGYEPGQMLGRDLRFLQGEASQPAALRRLKTAISSGSPVEAMLLNYRCDGETWDNYMQLFPVPGGDGRTRYFIGAHFEVPDHDAARRLAEHLEALRADLEALNGPRIGQGGPPVPTDILDPFFEDPARLLSRAARRLVLARIGALSVPSGAPIRRKADKGAKDRSWQFSFST